MISRIRTETTERRGGPSQFSKYESSNLAKHESLYESLSPIYCKDEKEPVKLSRYWSQWIFIIEEQEFFE